MKPLAGLLAAAVLAVASSMAFADEATGTIQAIDTTAMTVTLDDGAVYTLPAEFDASTLNVGDAVTVTYTVDNGENVATEVAPSN